MALDDVQLKTLAIEIAAILPPVEEAARESLAVFGDRAFEFVIPDHEIDQLLGHLEVLVEAANGINVLVEHHDCMTVAPDHVNAAEEGAVFISSMAAVMMKRLRESRQANTVD